jgi:DNA polymerase-3 subunit gamma/tau
VRVALALYRKYRPRTFAEVIGQEHVTEPLTQALRSGRLHHAYLFSGPRGCGKTSSARILARSLNCERGPTPEPCGECASCRSLTNDGGGSIDVIEIDAASHGGVDDARELRERAFFAPVASRYKIYVIDEAHMVSTQGFNALLKLVEEPPEYVKFVFATTEPDKVLGTIKSRTHHYPFRLIPPGVLRPYLEQLCEAEGVTVEPAVFPLVVRAGGGSARDTLSVLDQLMAGAGPEGVGYARAVALLGVTDAALIDEMCDALAAGDGAAAYATIDRVAEAGHDPRRFASDLLERLRDLIILQQVPDAAAKGLIDGPADQLERMSAQAQRMGPAMLSRCADIVHTGLVDMRGTTGPRLLLELICARMLLPGADDSSGALLQRLERVERRLALAGDVANPAGTAGSAETEGPGRTESIARPTTEATEPAPVPAPPARAVAAPRPDADNVQGNADQGNADQGNADRGGGGAREPAVVGAPVATGAELPARRPVPAGAVMPDPATPEPERPGVAPPPLDAAAVRRVWDEVLTLVGNKSKRAAALAREATVREVDGETLVLTFKHSVHASMFNASPELLVEAVYEVLGGRWELRCEVAGDARAEARPVPTQARPPGAGQPAPASSGRPQAGMQPAVRQPATRPAAGDRSGAGQQGAGQADDGDWPEPARLGGPAPDPAPGDAGATPGAAAPAGTAGTAPNRTAPNRTAPGTADTGPPRNAPKRAATRSGPAQAAAAAAARAGNGRGRVPEKGPAAGSAWDDGPPPGEPPFDPEFDGFDPGDEPLDDVIDEKTARQSSEAQALQLLQEKLGAEKIAELDAR